MAAPQSSRRSIGGGGIMGTAAVLLIYVLALGPVAKLHQTHPAARPLIEAIYSPLVYAGQSIGPLQQCLEWYVQSWL